jgi:hypothetical protein
MFDPEAPEFIGGLFLEFESYPFDVGIFIDPCGFVVEGPGRLFNT